MYIKVLYMYAQNLKKLLFVNYIDTLLNTIYIAKYTNLF